MTVGFFEGRSRVWAAATLLAAVNLAVVAPLFRVEYSAYTGSIEPTFIAIARVMAEGPGAWDWWPYWNGGMPFENAYLPLTQWLVAGFQLLSGYSPARSFHIVTAAAYALSTLPFYWLALVLSRRPGASFIAALAYSSVSMSALLIPAIRVDVGSAWNLRRLQDLAVYGEAPHLLSLALVPAAIVCFARAVERPGAAWKLAAGAVAAATALTNAFGVVALGMGLAAWLAAYRPQPWRRAWGIVAAIAALSYCWVSPWLSPSLIRGIRENAPTAGGDFRYTAGSWVALGACLAGYWALCRMMQRAKVRSHMQFFALFGAVPTAFTVLWHAGGPAVVPQPGRYEMEMDMALAAAAVFASAALIEHFSKRVRIAVAAAAIVALGMQTIHVAGYARELIRSVEPRSLSEYKIAKWLDANRPGDRTFVSGSTSFLFNVFSDNPQLHGGHDQHTQNSFIPIVDFAVRTGTNAGEREAEIAVFWLKAFGAGTVAVSAAGSTEAYQTYTNPGKFDGVLRELWREGGDVIYEVASESRSLAHVIPETAVVNRRPIHGLDIAPAEAFVAALDDPGLAPAELRWESASEAVIRAPLETGQVVAVQVSYASGWEAWADGRRQNLRADAIGQMIIEPSCDGACEITLTYSGGGERMLTRALSVAAMLVALTYALLPRRRATRKIGGNYGSAAGV